MKKIILFLFFCLLTHFGFSQWTVLDSSLVLGSRSAAFALGDIAFFFKGSYSQSVYAYNIKTGWMATNAITNYPNTETDGLRACSLNGTAYVATGTNGTYGQSFYKYKYSVTGGTWTALTNFPGAARAFGVMFAIGGRIYVGGGRGAANYTDFYYYDTLSSTWSGALTPCPATGVSSYSACFVIGNYAYVGTGALGGTGLGTTDFYRYDPVGNTWTAIASFPGAARQEANAWATCDFGYVGEGYNTNAQRPYFKDFWRYNPATNSWKKVSATYPGYGLSSSGCVMINHTGYLWGGHVIPTRYFGELFSYNEQDSVIASNYTGTVGAPICKGATVTFRDTTTVYDPGANIQWSFQGGNPSTATTPSVTVTYSVSGSYAVTLTTWNGCDSGSITFPSYVSVTAGPTVTVTPANPTICSGKSITLKASGSTSYQWVGAANTTDTIQASALSDTTYNLSISNGTCTGDTAIQVAVNPNPVVTISALPTAVCAGSSTTLSGYGGTSYSWSAGGTASSISVSPVSSTTEYVVTGTNAAGCSSKDSLTVTINPLPTIAVLPASPAICAGGTIPLAASGAGATGNYTWKPSTGITAPSSASTNGDPAKTTTYTVVGTNSNGCIDSTYVTLTVNQNPIPYISTMQTICAGGSTTLTASGGTGFTWLPVTGLSSSTVADPNASPVTSTQYTVTVSNGTCQATDTVTVGVNSLPALSVTGTNTIQIGSNTPLGVSTAAGNTYSWSPAATLSCNTCANPIATPTTTTWYTVTVTNASNCSDTGSILITVKELCGPVYVPTAFSPNGDGSNDIFKVNGNCIAAMNMTVFDRWGNVVFQTSNPAGVWDGTYKGKALNAGTYVYTLSVTDVDNNVMSKKGNITLLR